MLRTRNIRDNARYGEMLWDRVTWTPRKLTRVYLLALSKQRKRETNL